MALRGVQVPGSVISSPRTEARRWTSACWPPRAGLAWCVDPDPGNAHVLAAEVPNLGHIRTVGYTTVEPVDFAASRQFRRRSSSTHLADRSLCLDGFLCGRSSRLAVLPGPGPGRPPKLRLRYGASTRRHSVVEKAAKLVRFDRELVDSDMVSADARAGGLGLVGKDYHLSCVGKSNYCLLVCERTWPTHFGKTGGIHVFEAPDRKPVFDELHECVDRVASEFDAYSTKRPGSI